MPATAPSAPLTARASAQQPAAARVTLHTLGECRVVLTHADGTTTLTPASDRLFTLALLLAADPGRPVPRARVAAWLWPDFPTAAARHALRQLLYRLRRLGLTVDGDDAHLALAPQLVAPPAVLYGSAPRAGRCLPGWNPPGDALAAWLDRYRATTEAAARATLARALEDARAANRDGIALAAALLELDPQHPLARATLPRTAAVRETPPHAHALPCVGRDDVLAALRAHVTAARDGHGSAVVIAASPGAGATRLLEELSAAARALGVKATAAPAACAANRRSFALAVAMTVRTLLDRPGALGCGPDALRALRRFVATPVLPPGDATLRRLGAAVAELARAVAAEGPLVLAVDAPCTTPPERALAAATARGLVDAAVLALFLAAPGPLGVLGAATHVVALRALADHDAARLAAAAARARGAALSPHDVTWCVTAARGRPGDVIALADACAARPGTRSLPAAVAARLHDDVAALAPRTRQVAALYALLGDRATTDAIAHTLNRRHPAVEAAAAELRRTRLPGLPPTADDLPPHRDAARATGTIVLASLDPADRTALAACAAAVPRAVSPAPARQLRTADDAGASSARSAPSPSTSARPGSPL